MPPARRPSGRVPDGAVASPRAESMPRISSFLMFDGTAEEAIRQYVALFPDSGILSLAHYGEADGALAGRVRHASFTLAGQEFQCIDTPVPHAFTFTPAASIHVAFEDERELDRVYAELSRGGHLLMPLGPYPFSRRYAWFNDRFGVSWQLALAAPPRARSLTPPPDALTSRARPSRRT